MRAVDDPAVTPEYVLSLLSFDPESGWFRRIVARGPKKVGTRAGGPHPDGYRRIKIAGRKVFEHRLAWLVTYGSWPSEDIDHKNGERTDNRPSNLRLATAQQNAANTRRDALNTSGFKGVYAGRAGLWIAQIGRTYLGQFASPEAAHDVYKLAASQRFGDFARFD